MFFLQPIDVLLPRVRIRYQSISSEWLKFFLLEGSFLVGLVTPSVPRLIRLPRL